MTTQPSEDGDPLTELILNVIVSQDDDRLPELILKFMGAFSQVQWLIDDTIGSYVSFRMPQLGPKLARRLGRVADDERLDLFAAFAAEAGYDGDLTNFKRIYTRAKQVRDLIGHAHDISGTEAGGPPVVVIQHPRGMPGGVPDPLEAGTFVRLANDCYWLSRHVLRAGARAVLSNADPGLWSRVAELPAIPALPIEGEPLPGA